LFHSFLISHDIGLVDVGSNLNQDIHEDSTNLDDCTIFSSSSTHVWINAFGISMTATSLASSASIMHDNSMASVAMVGKLASSLEM
jgi:hypothetical protein